MDRAEIDCARDVEQELGEALPGIAACLWPIDCQTCGRALGAISPALVVEVFGAGMASASLHHASCRRSEWTEQGALVVVKHLTYRIRAMLMRQEPEPFVVAWFNPGLEEVLLELNQQGTWAVSLRHWEARGFRAGPIHPDYQVSGVDGKFLGDRVRLRVDGLDLDFDASHPINQYLDSERVFLLAITHAVDPDRLRTMQDVRPAYARRQLAWGWVDLRER